jgi:hypothetical protein
MRKGTSKTKKIGGKRALMLAQVNISTIHCHHFQVIA